MKKIRLGFMLLAFLITASLSAQTTVDAQIEHDGELRDYRLYIPASYTPGMELPLVINMHGFGSNFLEQLIYSNFNNVADSANIMVVYPQGLNRTIPGGLSGNSWNSQWGTGVDDVGFIDKLIDLFYTDYQIDLKRVYATGMSNGGFMSYTLACDLSDRIAAVASVTGAMVFSQVESCTPERPVPVMEIHGTNDGTIPYNGFPGFYPPLVDVVDFWVEFNGCGDPSNTVVEDINTADGSTASFDTYNCNDNTEVVFYTVENGGHTWPGAFPLPGASTNLDFSATSVVWNFFNRHEHPNPKAGTLLSNEDLENDPRLVKTNPNPFRDRLSIEFLNDKVENLRVIDVFGQIVFEKERNNGEQYFNIQVNDLESGIYFLEFLTENGAIVKKVIKQ